MVVDPNKTNVNEANLSSLARVTPLTSETSDNTETVKTFKSLEAGLKGIRNNDNDVDAKVKDAIDRQGDVNVKTPDGEILAQATQSGKADYILENLPQSPGTDSSPEPITPPGQPHNNRKHHHLSDKVKKFVNKSANKLKKGVKTVLGIPGQIGGALIAGGVGGAVDSVKSVVGGATKPIVNTAKAIGKRIKKMF